MIKGGKISRSFLICHFNISVKVKAAGYQLRRSNKKRLRDSSKNTCTDGDKINMLDDTNIYSLVLFVSCHLACVTHKN